LKTFPTSLFNGILLVDKSFLDDFIKEYIPLIDKIEDVINKKLT